MPSKKVVISLGSNVPDCEVVLAEARGVLKGFFKQIRFSEPVYTEPVGWSCPGNFLNQVAVACTDCEADEILAVLKRIERLLGRSPSDKQQGKVTIDIDLLRWNDHVLKPKDWRRDYVTRGIAAISSGKTR